MTVTLAEGSAVIIDAQLRDGLVSRSVAQLKVSVASFKYDIGGNRGIFIGDSDVSVTDDSTNYLYLDSQATLQVNTTGFPTTTHIPLARVPAANGEVTNVISERVLLASSSSAAGTCSIKFPVDGGVKGGNAAASSNNSIPSVTFAASGESHNRWNMGPPQNYISGDFTFRVKCSMAGTPGSNTARIGLNWTGFDEGDTLPSSYAHNSEQTVDLSAVTNDQYFFIDFTVDEEVFDTAIDTYAFELYRLGDHEDDTTGLTLHTHICAFNYYGYTLSGQAGQ